jgi:NAD(P)-dependent dehydrogenase (short-subunit alcohol dehydrogenase family)
MNVDGKVAVITGASRGLGAGMGEEFRRAGMKLGLCSRSAPALAAGDGVVARELDVVDGDAVDSFAAEVFERFGHVDLWINNAGVLAPIAPLRDVASAEFRRALDVNVLGVFHGTRAYVRQRSRTDKPGVLVNISSGAAWNGYAGWSAYCASKAAVDLMTESVALEEVDTGLRCYAVAPGVIDTDMQEMIRGCTPEQFPMVNKFIEMKEHGSFSSVAWVARHMLELAFGDGNDDVRIRFPAEA